MPEIQVTGRVVTLPLTTETDLLCDNMSSPDTLGIDITGQSIGFTLKNSHGIRNIASIAAYFCYEPTGTRWSAADPSIVLSAALAPGGVVSFNLRRPGARRMRLTATSATGGSEATLDLAGAFR